jgi:alpha-D-xyloside xylohydrolase
VSVVRQQLPRFLGSTRVVDVAVALTDGETVAMMRYAPGESPTYGTMIEAPLQAPVAAPPMKITRRPLLYGVERITISRTPVTGRGLIVDDITIGAPIPLDADAEPFRFRLADGRLTTRAIDIAALRRHDIDWAEYEHRWKVLHRYAYPLGCTADADVPAWFVSFDLAHDEQIFGLGEDFGPLGKRGTVHHLWMQEAYSNASPAVYKPIPFWWSTTGYGVLVNTTNPVRVDVGAADHTAISVVIDGVDHLDLVVIEGDSPAEILARYTAVTGHPRVPPRWTFGAWMGRMSYTSQAEVETAAAELRARRIPCDVIHIDTHWFATDWACDYRFGAERFPDPAGMLARLRGDGFRVCLWQWSNALVGTTTFDELSALGGLATTSAGAPYIQPGFLGDAGVIDWSNPVAIEWVQARIRDLIAMGVAAIKTDFGEGAPVDAKYHAIDGWAMHNAYPLLYNAAIQAAIDEVTDDGVVWSRSGWAGSQRFPIAWSGDGVARWEDLACVVRSMLSIGMSGIPFYAHDVGGFSGVPEPKLYIRWAQLGAFSSHLRFHGFPPREPWAYGEEAERVVRAALELRYRLLPYLWQVAAQAGASGLPMCRAMAIAFPDDRNCRDLDDQYLLGEDLLVAPILSERDERMVYLPSDQWVRFDNDAPMTAGWHRIHADIDEIQLFRRTSASIPMRELAQHTGA